MCMISLYRQNCRSVAAFKSLFPPPPRSLILHIGGAARVLLQSQKSQCCMPLEDLEHTWMKVSNEVKRQIDKDKDR